MPKRLELPCGEHEIHALEAGDEVLVSGVVVTAREAAHRALLARDAPGVRADLANAGVYHCAPVVARDRRTGSWTVLAAGPAASPRVEPWQAELLVRYGARAILGAGGMGPRTLAALSVVGAAYLHAARGLAVGLARRVRRIVRVHHLAGLAAADALWVLELDDFPAVVTMDARGRSLHAAAAPGAGASA